ncbi:MAG: helix-turn-helix domain-containing protein [Gemmataceae bacterium]|nr:helix-turn-helix domain-containing protein [Gemmataceae bacterium]
MKPALRNETSLAKRHPRPFPWRCSACGKVDVAPAVVRYTANVRHHGRTHKVRVADLCVLKCRACGALVFQNDSHQQIARALRRQLGLLQPEEIREGRRQANDITQEQLAQAIDAAVATVSRWETGAVIQSRRADKAMRRFFATQAEQPLSARVSQLVESLVSDVLSKSRSDTEKEALLKALCARKKELGDMLATAVRE